MDISWFDPARIFRIANGLALLGWLALAASPPSAPWSETARRLATRGLPLLLAVVYVVMLAVHWPPGGGFGTLGQVQALFAAPGALVAGWLHYLAFDLFVGGWIVEQGRSRGWPQAWLLPLLALTFLFGPAGLLAYALLARALPAPRQGVVA